MQLAQVDEAKTASMAAVYDDSDSDEEGMAEAAQLVGAANISDMARHAASNDRSADDEFQKLLGQLRNEPDHEDETMAKFALFETYSQQVELIRKRLFDLYMETKP